MLAANRQRIKGGKPSLLKGLHISLGQTAINYIYFLKMNVILDIFGETRTHTQANILD